MANVTKPIALNETFKTTESTPRNLADVLAQALQALNTTISGLNFLNCVVVQILPTTGISTTTIYLVPKNPAQTDNLYDEYINLTGTSAGWEKIGDTEIDLSDYYNKTETDTLLSGKVDKVNGKGLSTNDYTTAEKTKLAGIEAGAEVNPTSGVKTATESFETVDGGLLSKCQINLVPVQSGSGDPYPAGGGKNKFDGTSIIQANIQSNGTISNASVNNRIIYCKCSPSTTYTISKTSGTAFRVACYSSEPTNGSTSVGTVTTDNTASSITITTDASATYIGAWVWNSADSLTADQMLATCQIELGNQATPYAPPSNIRPISGHTEVDLYNVGKNLYNGLSEIGSWVKQRCTATFNGDGSITATNTQSGATWIGYIGTLGTTVNINNCPCSKGDSLIITSGNDTVCSNITVGEVDSSNILLKATAITSGTTYTVTEDNTTAIVLRYGLNLSDGASGTIYPMIRKSTETDSTFEPYLGHLYQVQIGSTVYGGYVDLVSGVMVATRKCVKGNSLVWQKHSYASNNVYYTYSINSEIKPSPDTHTIMGILSSSYVDISWDGCFSQNAIGMGVANNGTFCISNPNITTLSDFETSIANVDICYEMATPLTIQLTPQEIETLAGQNNLSTPLSGQSIETNGVEYKELFTFADVKEYVDKKIPDAPTTDGTYTLTAVVSGGVPTYSWV